METLKTAKWAPFKQQHLGKDISEVANQAAEILNILCQLPEYDRKDREGGLLALAGEYNRWQTALAIGEVPDNDPDKYCGVAFKKCYSLNEALHDDEVNNPVMSSFLLRNEESGIYGGGILLGRFLDGSSIELNDETCYGYLAFSGLPELADEALVLVLAIDMKWIYEKFAQDIAKTSSNPYFDALLKASRK